MRIQPIKRYSRPVVVVEFYTLKEKMRAFSSDDGDRSGHNGLL